MSFKIPDSLVASRDDGRFMLNTQRCKSCHAAIVWIVTDSGAKMPLSAGTARDENGELVADSHFADCPDAKAHRRKKQ